MIRIEVRHVFPVSVSEAFSYIVDMRNWPEYWPRFVRIKNPGKAQWSDPGDRAIIVIRLLLRERAMHMELTGLQGGDRVTYTSRQKGLPDARHERYFRAVPDGCEYRLVVEYEPRPGLAGVMDRLLLKRSVQRTMQMTLRNLDRIFRLRRGTV